MLLESIDDWQQHFTDSFITVETEDGTVLPFLVSGVEPSAESSDGLYSLDDVEFYGLNTMVEGGIARPAQRSTRVRTGKGATIRAGFPNLGMANYGDHVLYFCYSPRRQWKKSLSTRMIECTSPVLAELRAMHRGIPGLNHLALYNILNNNHTKVGEAIEGLYSGEFMGRAIGSYFAMVVKRGAKAPILVYKNQAVGYATKDGTIHVPQEVGYLADELLLTTDLDEGAIYYE